MLPTENQYTGTLCKTPNGTLSSNVLLGSPMNLYFTSDEKPEVGDWCVYFGTDIMEYDYNEIWDKDKCRKIISTTDTSLSFTNVIKHHLPSLPQPSQSFIAAFCKAGGIWKVLVEYEVTYEEDIVDFKIVEIIKEKLKVNSNNEITIHPIKNIFTTEEMKNFGLWLGNNIKKHKNKSIDSLFDEWIKL